MTCEERQLVFFGTVINLNKSNKQGLHRSKKINTKTDLLFSHYCELTNKYKILLTEVQIRKSKNKWRKIVK